MVWCKDYKQEKNCSDGKKVIVNIDPAKNELKTKTKAVRKDCATDLKPLRKAIKQFVPRLNAVEEKQGCCIKMIFG